MTPRAAAPYTGRVTGRPADTRADIRVHAVAVTYGRPDELIRTLDAFGRQTRPPDTVLVVDNGADDEVRRLVAGRTRTSYVAMSDNLGPAGAIAAGFDAVAPDAAPDDWILLIDDDDPPRFDTAVADVLDVARSAPPDVAVVGLTGARYDRWTGRLRRLRDDQLRPLTDVDYVGNGQCPLYRVPAVRAVGGPDQDLFFQFEELDLGLRLRRRGWRLVVDRALTLRTRRESGRLGLGRRARPTRRSSPWRAYYSARNQVLVGGFRARWQTCHRNRGRGIRQADR